MGGTGVFSSIGFGICAANPGGGGAIRLVAPTIGGNGSLNVLGGAPSNIFSVGDPPSVPGLVRLEAFNDNFRGSIGGPFVIGSPSNLFLPSPHASVKVTTVDNVNVKQPPTGNLATPDVIINNPGPVTI